MNTFVPDIRTSLVLGLVALLMAVPVSAYSGHGYGHGSGHGHRGHHSRTHVGVRFGRGYHGHHRRHRSSVSFAWYGPLYVEPRRHVVDAARPAVVEQSTRVSRHLPDMPTFVYLPLEGQDPEQVTLDRRLCERQAWRATRSDPAAGTVHVQRSVRYVESRAQPDSPLPRAAHGALLGAIGGAIAGDAGLGAAIGAVVGTASWLIGSAHAQTVSVPEEVVTRQYVPAPGPDAAALRAALMACMEARGYDVR